MSINRSILAQVTIEIYEIAKSLRHMPVKESRAAVEDFLAGLDTDSYEYARQWIADNPVSVKPCPRCTRMTMTCKDGRCEYCKGLVP